MKYVSSKSRCTLSSFRVSAHPGRRLWSARQRHLPIRMHMPARLIAFSVAAVAAAAMPSRATPPLIAVRTPRLSRISMSEQESIAKAETRARLCAALCGLSLYGGGAYVWQWPVLLDRAIGLDLHLTDAQMLTTRTAIFAAWAVGSTLFGSLADRVGRKPVAIGAAILALLHLLGCASSTGFASLMFFRVLGGLSIGGMLIGFSLALESAAVTHKSSTATMLNCFACGSIGLIVLMHAACEAMRLPWRVELCAIAAMFALLVGASARLVPESTEWLKQRRQSADERDADDETSRPLAVPDDNDEERTRDDFTDSFAASVPIAPTSTKAAAGRQDLRQGNGNGSGDGNGSTRSNDGRSGGGAYVQLFSRAYRGTTIALALGFAAVSVVYFSLTLQAGSTGSSVMLNVLFLSLLDLPGYKLADFLSSQPAIGVRGAAMLLFAGAACVMAALAAATAFNFRATSAFAFAGKLLAAGAFQQVYLLPDGGFPPSIRGTGYGACAMFARLISIAVPAIAASMTVVQSSLLCAAFSAAAAVAMVFANDRHERW